MPNFAVRSLLQDVRGLEFDQTHSLADRRLTLERRMQKVFRSPKLVELEELMVDQMQMAAQKGLRLVVDSAQEPLHYRCPVDSDAV